jgi:hypothetical protein
VNDPTTLLAGSAGRLRRLDAPAGELVRCRCGHWLGDGAMHCPDCGAPSLHPGGPWVRKERRRAIAVGARRGALLLGAAVAVLAWAGALGLTGGLIALAAGGVAGVIGARAELEYLPERAALPALASGQGYRDLETEVAAGLAADRSARARLEEARRQAGAIADGGARREVTELAELRLDAKARAICDRTACLAQLELARISNQAWAALERVQTSPSFVECRAGLAAAIDARAGMREAAAAMRELGLGRTAAGRQALALLDDAFAVIEFLVEQLARAGVLLADGEPVRLDLDAAPVVQLERLDAEIGRLVATIHAGRFDAVAERSADLRAELAAASELAA